MSLLEPGTLCVTVGSRSGDNNGVVVRVISYYGPHAEDSRIVEGYWIVTVSGKPFKSVKSWDVSRSYRTARNVFSVTIADRRNLRVLLN